MGPNVNKIKGISSWDYLMVLIMIYVSGKTLLFSTNANQTYVFFSNFFPLFFFPLLYIYTNKRKKSLFNNVYRNRLNPFFIAFAILFLCTAVVNLDFRGGYVITILLFLTGFLYASVTPLKLFLTVFEKIIWWIAFLSILLFFIRSIFPGFLNYFPVVVNTRDFQFANCIVSVFPLVEGSGALRLYGPFSEPGVYQIYLNLALIFNIYISGRLELTRALVYVTAIILTQSTAGYICLAIFLLYYILETKKNRARFYNYLMSFVIIIAIAVAYTRTSLLSADSDVFVKMTDENVSTISRMASVKINLELFMSHPFFGVGLTDIAELFDIKCKEFYGFSQGIANTNTFLFQLAAFGPLYLGLWIYCFYYFFKKLGISIQAKFLVFIGVVMLFSSEMMTGCLMLYVFLGYGLLDKREVILSEKVDVRQ